jgi:uncharacterized lipoprotein YmbA
MNYYKITKIEFDFDGEDLTQEEQDDIIQEATNCLWTSPTEEELTDTITNNTGWCINSLAYDVIVA